MVQYYKYETMYIRKPSGRIKTEKSGNMVGK